MKITLLRGAGMAAVTLALSLGAGLAQAAKVLGDWTPVFQGIDYLTAYETDVQYPGEAGLRRLAVNAMRIDLTDPGIRFMTTPGNGTLAGDTQSQTTGAFLEQHDLQVAVNANFFSPCCAAATQPKDLTGLAISEGQVVSPADYNSIPPGGTADSLVITQDNRAAITHVAPGSDVSLFYSAVSGGPVLVNAGEIAVSLAPADSWSAQNPRTAVGISADGSFLLLMTIDGRQPGYSEGATLYETASWLLALGAYQGLNLDGGGSTSMVMADADGDAQYLNRLSAGAPRFNGNHLGVYAAALPVPEPSTYLMLAIGLLVLAAATRGRRMR
ncbi:phosphodiester glycosidase family protein [Aquincola sp. MAHUQ-54]|uniref:Phosphodiester glycosidase family protein n=1 Tax=Aquincola agrisoli TaxID=3119538 RepID=A0AAW9QK44_9BURK